MQGIWKVNLTLLNYSTKIKFEDKLEKIFNQIKKNIQIYVG